MKKTTTKQAPTAKKKAASARATILIRLLDGIRAVYRSDHSMPGVLLSRLADGHYYAAIHRYRESYGGRREIVCAVTHPTDLGEAIRTLARKWIEAPTLVEELRKSLANS